MNLHAVLAQSPSGRNAGIGCGAEGVRTNSAEQSALVERPLGKWEVSRSNREHGSFLRAPADLYTKE